MTINRRSERFDHLWHQKVKDEGFSFNEKCEKALARDFWNLACLESETSFNATVVQMHKALMYLLEEAVANGMVSSEPAIVQAKEALKLVKGI